MRNRLAAVGLVAVTACAAAYGIHWFTAPGASSGPGAVNVAATRADISFVVPPGTGARLDRGERVEILPARIEARVGQVIRLVNRDSRGYLLGPFYVGARETLTQRFTSPGTFEGACAVHPSGQIVLVVLGRRLRRALNGAARARFGGQPALSAVEITPTMD